MRRRPIADFYERTCVDCGEPLYLYYQGPLSKAQSLWTLTDEAQEWIDQYPESGNLEEEDLLNFLTRVRDLTALNYNTLPEKYRFLFDVARQRGFFESAGGGDDVAGRYDLRCSKQSCRSKSHDRRTRQDPRGMSININDDGSQDEFEKAVKRDSSYQKAVGCCPVCGTLTMMEAKENLFCSECGQNFRLKESGKGYDQV